ncbi:MAG: VanZ family protein [Candidatus Cloacimonetes bacterium]|nr:VanZ family protein [Candidatus Cloacimonadota bacterium]MCF7813528.1 VanZ family protein [Candidatus Cloacimonadota bacterium]MCF7868688.1 VanZ family protein [Candidatus Cloacimonadota bacterium]MCF7884182.1 VanZ family protein [Candidatus Cloacimonadota bacterium]
MIDKKVYKILFFAWWAVILVLTSYPKLRSPVDDSLNFDKLAHCLVYFIYAWLFVKMHGNNISSKTLKKLLLLALIIPLFDELHQIPIPGRGFSGWDILADLIGFAIVIFIFRKKISNRRSSHYED